MPFKVCTCVIATCAAPGALLSVPMHMVEHVYIYIYMFIYLMYLYKNT